MNKSFDSIYVFLKTTLFACVGLAFIACTSSENTVSNKNDAKPVEWTEFTNPEANEFSLFCKANYEQVKTLFAESEQGLYADYELLVTLNEMDRLINASLGRASLFSNVHPNAEHRESAKHCDQRFTSLISQLGLSQDLYRHVKNIDLGSLSGVDKRYAEDTLQAFKRSGVNLDAEKRAKVKVLNQEINDLGNLFYKNSREDVRQVAVPASDLAGLPDDFISERLDADTQLVTITTNYPDYLPVMQYAENDSLRFELYKLFRSRGNPSNKDVLNSLLAKRYELAQLLGYKSHAAYASEVQMIGTETAAQAFIDSIKKIATPLAQAEYNELLAELKTIDPSATAVGDWQKTFLQERIKKAKYSVDSQAVRQYFPYDHVKSGIFSLVNQLFGVEIRPWDTQVWSDDVEAFELVENGRVLGQFFLDMHPRENKYKHAAAFTLQDGLKNTQLPVKALVCNFPSGNELMEHKQVETFLHEFGHLLHGILGGHPKWISHAGTSTERDFVEAPSQMLEEWVWDSSTLALLSRNSDGETVPEPLIDKMNASRNFGKGIFTTQQMFYAAVSLNYYDRDPSTFDDTELLIQLQEKYGNFAYVDDTAFQYAFGHLVGYSSVYYGYMWSLVISDDMFSEFQKHSLMNKDVAARYRKHILEPGGSMDAATMVENFLGRPYTFDAFSEKFK